MNTSCYAVSDTNLKKIIAHYGKDSQRMKALEELNECAVAIAHDSLEEIEEEIADAFLMLLQMIILYKIPERRIFENMETKIKRTFERIDAEK